MKYKAILALALSLQMLMISAALAKTYHLSASKGDDKNNGLSPSAPWKSLNKVKLARLNPGDQILFKRGDQWELKEALIVKSSGSASKPITFGAYGKGQRPILKGKKGGPYWGIGVVGQSGLRFEHLHIQGYGQSIHCEGCSNVVIENMLLTDASGISLFVKKSKDMSIKNNTIRDIAAAGIQIYDQSTRITIENNKIHDVGLAKHGEGIYIGTDPLKNKAPDKTSHVVIRNNTIYNAPHEGIELKPATRNCIVDNNTIYNVPMGILARHEHREPNYQSKHVIKNNMIYNLSGKANGGSPPYGIYMATDGTVLRNIISNVSNKGQGYGIRVADSRKVKIYHNTIHKIATQAMWIDGKKASYDIRNNLVGSDKDFADPQNGDFRLCERKGQPVKKCAGRSAALDAGVKIGMVFHGSSPDLGAIETGNKLQKPQKPQVPQKPQAPQKPMPPRKLSIIGQVSKTPVVK